MLMLQSFEKEEYSKDELLEEFAEDFEDYMLPDDVIQQASDAFTEHSLTMAAEQRLDTKLRSITHKQERQLVSAVLERFGVSGGKEEVAAGAGKLERELDALMSSLSKEDVGVLIEAVVDSPASTTAADQVDVSDGTGEAVGEAASEAAGKAADSSSSNAAPLLRALALPIVPAMESVVAGFAPLDLGANASLAQLPRLETAEDASGSMRVDFGTQASPPNLSTGVVPGTPTSVNARGIPSYSHKANKRDQLGEYTSWKKRPELLRVSTIDSGESLEANLEERQRQMTHDPCTRRKRIGALVFVDVSKRLKRRKPDSAPRDVWVNHKNETREPSKKERIASVRRVDPPQLTKRIWRIR